MTDPDAYPAPRASWDAISAHSGPACAYRAQLPEPPKWKFLSEPAVVPPPFNVATVFLIGPENVVIQLTQKSQSAL